MKTRKKIDELQNNSKQNPMVFMNAGGASSSSSSSSSAVGNPNGFGTIICTKNKVLAGILAILFGGIGVHKFYLGNIGLGILYLLFFWTTIPAFIGFIEGIIILATSDDVFNMKYGRRIY